MTRWWADSAWAGGSLLALLACSLIGATGMAGEPSSITRFARFRCGETIAYGIVEHSSIRVIDGTPFGDWTPTDVLHPLAKVDLLVPCEPSKVLAVGLNYRSHLGERPEPKVPEIFFKVPSCLVRHEGDIVLPRESKDVHFEAEMVIVIGKKARQVRKERALEYVLGVTCGNDVSARDWQAADLQWWRAKGHDTFGPVGPVIVAGLDYDDLKLELRLNGEVQQEGRTSDLIFDVAEIVSFVSRHVTLKPGDLIFTGTPGQTSALKPGDVVEVHLEGVGTLRNHVRDHGPPR